MNSYLDKLRAVFGVELVGDSALETYLKKNYKLIDNIAYAQKRNVAGQSYGVYLNEMFQPNAFEVARFKLNLLLKGTTHDCVRNVASKVAQNIVWTDDKNLDTSGDYYLYPSETIVLKKADCEDMSYLVGSCLPEDAGVAYGYYDDGKTRFAHAWNVFLHDGTLYHADTNSTTLPKKARLEADKEDGPFIIHYIITTKYTFEVRRGVRFGELAGGK